VYKYQNDLEKAVVDLTKAINIEKGNPDFLADRAAMYISLKKWNEAKADLDNALSMSEFVDKFNAYYLRGACNTQLEDIKAATEDLKQAYDYATTEEMKQMVVSAYEKIHPRDDNSQYVQDAAASYFRGSIGSFPIVMYLTLSNGGKASGWYYYESKGANNKLVLSGNYNQDGDITLYEFDETGNHTGKFVGQYNNREYSGTFSAYGNSSTYSFSLIEL
jgi:tetratricopeptide (TPR) repeat protein